tara:strand:+ start:7766 stop:8335 length:570 start_codon:yes stop_codon:yes gene_type:complete
MKTFQAIIFIFISFSVYGQSTNDMKPQVEVNTNMGNFIIELDKGRAPITVNNFIRYTEEGFYSGTIFHRVVQGFVAQAGGYDINLNEKEVGEDIINESGNGLSNLRGSVGLARLNSPHSGNAQFYINLSDNLDLNPRPTRWGYTVFGTIIQGMEVVDKIGHVPTTAKGTFERNVPVDSIIIETIELLEN